MTAVEIDPELARMYQERFPNDIVIVADAHQYLLDHFKEFDFIWSSPPCPSHSRTNTFLRGQGVYRFPDMQVKGDGRSEKRLISEYYKFHDYDFTRYKKEKGKQRVAKIARNLVDYEAGRTILETAFGIIRKEDVNQLDIFNDNSK